MNKCYCGRNHQSTNHYSAWRFFVAYKVLCSKCIGWGTLYIDAYKLKHYICGDCNGKGIQPIPLSELR